MLNKQESASVPGSIKNHIDVYPEKCETKYNWWLKIYLLNSEESKDIKRLSSEEK